MSTKVLVCKAMLSRQL